MLIVYGFSVSQFAEKIQRELAETGETVGIFVEVAEHVIVLGAEVVVASVIGEDQRIEEQTVRVGRQFAEQRTARAGQGFFFDLAQQPEHFLAGAALNDFLAYLK